MQTPSVDDGNVPLARLPTVTSEDPPGFTNEKPGNTLAEGVNFSVSGYRDMCFTIADSRKVLQLLTRDSNASRRRTLRTFLKANSVPYSTCPA